MCIYTHLFIAVHVVSEMNWVAFNKTSYEGLEAL